MRSGQKLLLTRPHAYYIIHAHRVGLPAWAKYINIEYCFNNKTKEHKNKRTCSFQVYIPLVQAISFNSFQVYLFWLLMAQSRKSGFPLFVEH